MRNNAIENLQESFSFCVTEQIAGPVQEVATPVESRLDFSIDNLPESELTEVVCSDAIGSLYALLPCLARLSEQNRWITLIAPPAYLDEKLFALFGIDPSRVLLIHPKDKAQETQVMNTALKNGKSGIVIYWTDKLSKRFLAQWRKSVKQGECSGVVVNGGNVMSDSLSVAVTLSVHAMDKYIKVQKLKEFGVEADRVNETILPRFAVSTSTSNRCQPKIAHH
ncbi:MAG: SulA-like leucine-rich domain-containing protein [Gammaproteobacteria bacterium]|nr:SulA-like leucine-rich domain-containing protein [Gammaproteobacteria bacterium]